MTLDADTYAGGNDAKFLIISEANKIAKLAVTMATSKLPPVLKQNGMTVKKVPNKLIYLLESKTRQTFTLNAAKRSTTPFTIITKNIDLIIEGSLQVNGMFVVQGGNITFNEDPATRCQKPQTVKGIFVTD